MKLVMIVFALISSCQCQILHKTAMQDHQDKVTRSDKNVFKMNVKEKSTLPTIELRIKRQSKESNSWMNEEDTPKLFSGKLADIPITVKKSRAGSIVTEKGVQYIWHQELTSDDCSMACEIEAAISCRYYLYADMMCIMMEHDHVKLTKMETSTIAKTLTTDTTKTKHKAIRGAPINTSKNSFSKNKDLNMLKQMVDQIENKLEASINSLQSGDHSNEKYMHGLQIKQSNVQKALNLLNHKLKTLNSINPEVIKRVDMIKNKQVDLVEEIKNMGEYENQIGSALNSVDSKVINLNDNLNLIRQTNEKIFRQLTGEESTNPEYNKYIIELKRQMMKLVNKIEMNPTLLKMTTNQRVLAQALEAVDREIIVNQRRLTHLDDITSGWGGRLIAEEDHRKVLNDALQALSTTVKNAKNDLLKLFNPQSSVNAERNKKMWQMKSDIQILERSNKKLKRDMVNARLDLNRLVKDLVNVQVTAHDSKVNIVALMEANKNMKLDFHQLKIEQNQMSTQIQTLATVYRSVLAALHSLEVKQIKVMHHLGKYENEMHRVSSEFLGDEKDLDKDTVGMKQLFHDFPLLLTMKNFQAELLKLVYHLKSNLDQVRKQLHMEVKHLPRSITHKDKKHTDKKGQDSLNLFKLQMKPKIPEIKVHSTSSKGANSPNLFRFQQNPKITGTKEE